MKRIIITGTLTTVLIYSGLVKGQNCESMKLKSGTKLIYHTETAPVNFEIFKGDYWKKSEKERKKIDEKFEKETPWTKDVQTNVIKISPNNDGTTEIKSTVTRASQAGITTDYSAYCKNDTMVNRPGFVMNNNGAITEYTYYNPTASGYSLMFEKATPNKLEIGQKIMDQQVSFSFTTSVKNLQFPMQKEVSKEVTSYGNYNSHGRWNELYSITTSKFQTELVDVIIESAVFGEALTKNRIVKEKKEVQVNGTTYTAFLIHEEQWTGGVGCEVKSDNAFINKHNKKFSDKMARKTADVIKETLKANDEGYVVTTVDLWYIPGVGAYSMTTYDVTGKKIGYLELKEIL